MGSCSNNETSKGEKCAQALNIYFDILIDEERYEEVYESVLFYEQNKCKKINEELEKEVENPQNKKETQNRYISIIRKYLKRWEKYLNFSSNSNDYTIFISKTNELYIYDQTTKEKESCHAINQYWKPLFIVKGLRAWLQSKHNSDAYEALDELGSFLVGQTQMLETNKQFTCSQDYPDFEVLYYLEVAACYKGELSIGYAQKALEKIGALNNELRDPYELVAIYHKGLGLYHKAESSEKEGAIRELDQIIGVFTEYSGEKEWDKNYRQQAQKNGTEGLWERYIFLPSLLCKAESLMDLQRSYECNRTLGLIKNTQKSYPKTVYITNEIKINLSITYIEIRSKILQCFSELDTGKIWGNKKDLKDCKKLLEKKLIEIAKLFIRMNKELGKGSLKDHNLLKESDLLSTLKEIKGEVLTGEDLLAQKHIFKSLVVRALKDLTLLNKTSKDIFDYLSEALDISYNEFNVINDKEDKDEKAENLKEWLESFEVLTEFLLYEKKNNLIYNIDARGGCKDSQFKCFLIKHFSFLVEINENVNKVKKGKWLNYHDDIMTTVTSILQKLNDDIDNLSERLASIDVYWHDKNNNIFPLCSGLFKSEALFIVDYILDKESLDNISSHQISKFTRRLGQLKLKLKKNCSRHENFQDVINKIDEKMKDEKIQKFLLPDNNNYYGHVINFSKQINRDLYLKVMRQNTENFDNRLIYHSVRYKDKNDRIEDAYCLTVLRKWQSYTPSLAGGPVTSLGGGYFVYKTDKNGEIEEGIVIDPGFDFVENFFEQDFSMRDITAVIMTHDHIDHNADFRAILGLFNEMNKRGRKRIHVWKEQKIYVVSTAGCFEHFATDIKDSKDFFRDTIVADPCNNYTPHPIKLDHFVIEPAPAFHKDLRGKNCMGVVIKTKEEIPLIGFTGDTVWTKTLAERYNNCPVMCINIGGIIDVRKDDCFERVFDEPENVKKLICKENHLYLPGLMLLLEEFTKEGKLQMVIISEIGEELKGGLREDLAQRIKDYSHAFICKKSYPVQVLAEDIGLTIELPEPARSCNIRIKCDKCKGMISAGEIYTVTRTTARGIEQLYRYCNQCYQCYLRLTESEKQDF